MTLRFNRVRLGSQVFLISVVAASSVLAATLVVVEQTVGEQLRQSYLEQSRTTAGTIAGAAIDALITEDGPLLQTIAKQVIERDRRILAIVIENEAGIELAAAGPRSSIEGADSGAQGLLHFAERLEYGGEEFGHVMITWSSAGLHAAIDRTVRRVLIRGGLILSCLAAIVFLLLHRVIVAPLQGIVTFLQSGHANAPTSAPPVQHSLEMQFLADQAAGIVELVNSEKRLRSEADESSERLRLLVDEMDHRVKNNLASIVGLIQRRSLSAETSAELADGLIDWIMSMSRTHEALAQTGWTGVSLTDDLPRILDPGGAVDSPGQVSLTGPEVTVAPTEAMPLCMSLSELMTNARKHGSLSVEGGRVELRWTREGDELRVVWQELGGPPVVAPNLGDGIRSGLGLVRGLVEYQLGGSIEMDFRPEGFSATLRVPLPRADAGAGADAAA